MQLQVVLRVSGILILPGCGGVTHPGQMVLATFSFRNACVLALSDLPNFTCVGLFWCIDFTRVGSRSTSPQYSRAFCKLSSFRSPHSNKILGRHGGGIAQQVAGLEVFFHVAGS